MNLIISLIILSFLSFPVLQLGEAHAETESMANNQASKKVETWNLDGISSTIDLKYNLGSFQMGDDFKGAINSSLMDFTFGFNISPWDYGLFLGYGIEKFNVSKENYPYFEGAQTKERAGIYTKYDINHSFYLLGKLTVYQELNLKNFKCEEYFYDLNNNYDHTETTNKNVKFRGREFEIGGGYHISKLFSVVTSYFSATYITKSTIKKEDHPSYNYNITNNVPARLNLSGMTISLSIELH